MPEIEDEIDEGRVSVGETGFVSEEEGGLIEEDVVKRLVRIEIATRGNEYPEGEPCGDDGERKGIQM